MVEGCVISQKLHLKLAVLAGYSWKANLTFVTNEGKKEVGCRRAHGFAFVVQLAIAAFCQSGCGLKYKIAFVWCVMRQVMECCQRLICVATHCWQNDVRSTKHMADQWMIDCIQLKSQMIFSSF